MVLKQKINIIIFFTIFFLEHVHAQTDSLINVVYQNTDPKKSNKYINKIIDHCQTNTACFLNVLQQTKKLTFNEELLKLYLRMSGHLNQDNLPGVIDICKEAIFQTNRYFPNDHRLGHFYNNISLHYIFKGKLDSAFYYVNLSDVEYKKHKLTDVYHKPDYNRYLIYLQLKDFTRADKYLWKSYNYVKDSPNRMNKGFLLHSILLALKERGDKKQFDKYFEEYIKFKKSGNSLGDVHHMALEAYFEDGHHAKIELEKVLKKLEKDSISLTTKEGKGLLISEIYAKEGNLKKSDSILTQIIDHENTTSQAKLYALYQWYESNKKAGNHTVAYLALERYLQLQNTINNQLLNTKIADYEVKYQTQEKENEISKQKTLMAEDRLKLRTSYGLILSLGIVSLLIWLFLRSRIKHDKIMNAKEQEIQSQKIKELEQENKVLALNAMIEGQEAERLRIAQDLHDGLGGLLTTVKAHFNAIEREINAVKNLNIYDKTNDLIDKACIEVRRIAHNMVPHSIQISGLIGAIKDLKSSIISRGMKCDLDIHNIETLDISQEKSSMIYRVVQEVTNNALKHSNASNLFVQLMKNEDMLHIIIEDDGKGFDINQILSKKGMGLQSIESRIKYLNGKIHYDSSPNHGTTVNIEVPL